MVSTRTSTSHLTPRRGSLPATAQTELEPDQPEQGTTSMADQAQLLLTQLLPSLKKLLASNHDDNLPTLVESIVTSFLDQCQSLLQEKEVNGIVKNGKRPASPPDDLTQKIEEVKSIIDARLAHLPPHPSSSVRSRTINGEPTANRAVPKRKSYDRTTSTSKEPLITNVSDDEVLMKISEGAQITSLRRFTPDGLTSLINRELQADEDLNEISVERAELMKTGDMSIRVSSAEGADLLRQNSNILEKLFPTAKILSSSYKVLMHGIDPFTVKLVDEAEEQGFVEALREQNPLIASAQIDFVDFEVREDFSRKTTIALDFHDVEHANAAVQSGLVWGEDSKVRTTEHYNATCNLVFPELQEEYCREIRERRVVEQKRKEEEDRKDSRLRHSRIFSPSLVTGLAGIKKSVSDSTNPSQPQNGKRKEVSWMEDVEGIRKRQKTTSQMQDRAAEPIVAGVGSDEEAKGSPPHLEKILVTREANDSETNVSSTTDEDDRREADTSGETDESEDEDEEENGEDEEDDETGDSDSSDERIREDSSDDRTKALRRKRYLETPVLTPMPQSRY